MPAYELSLLLKVLPRTEMTAALKRVGTLLLDQGVVIQKLENLGEKNLPYRMTSDNQHIHKGQHFFIKMNHIVKRNPSKLWKHSVTSDKKQKLSKKRKIAEQNDVIEKQKSVNSDEKVFQAKQEFNENHIERQKLKRKKSDHFSPNKKIKQTNTFNDKKSGFKKNWKNIDHRSNIKSEAQNLNNKMKKPNDMARKDWKMLHLNKKSSKSSSDVKPEAIGKKAWKKLRMEKKGKTEIFEVGKTLKTLWEELRREDCTPDKKNQLLKQICSHLKGRVKEFTFAHDTVRVLESVFSLGAETHRSLLLDELKDEYLHLAKSKYGKFFLSSVLRHGSKLQKDAVMKSFHGKVISLIKHTKAAEVVELAFNECANATQRFEFIQEFFGASYKFFKVSDVNSLEKLIEANPEKKSVIIQNMKEELMKVLDKSVVKHSIVHNVLWQFMKHSDESSRAEIIESLRDIVPEILHTKDGSRMGMHCIWHGTMKDRKHIVKSMKKFTAKIAVEEHGHMVLLAAFDVVDDTKLIEKNIIMELQKDLLNISQNIHGKKVLIYLLSPRDSHFFHPDVINILKAGDENTISKKDPESRQNELKTIISPILLKTIKDNIQELHSNNAFCLFTVTVLQHAVGDRKEAFESIADLLVQPYTFESKNTHPVERSGSNFMLKQLVIHDQADPDADCTFSETLVNKVPNLVLCSWIECNRGAFLLVSLLETKIPVVVAKVKDELEGRKKYLAKKNYKGAEILLKKLKE